VVYLVVLNARKLCVEEGLHYVMVALVEVVKIISGFLTERNLKDTTVTLKIDEVLRMQIGENKFGNETIINAR